MIIYRQKTILKRTNLLKNVLNELIQLKKDHDADQGQSICDSKDVKTRDIFYTWKYADRDIPRILGLLKTDLSLKVNVRNWSVKYPKMDLICADLTFRKIHRGFVNNEYDSL